MTHLSKLSYSAIILTFALALSSGAIAADPKGKKLGAGSGECMQGMKDSDTKNAKDCLDTQMQHQDEMKQMQEEKKQQGKDMMEDMSKGKGKGNK